MGATQDFRYQHDSLTLTGRLATPSGDGPHPAVMVMHSALGPDDLGCRRAGDLAALGYVGVATDMFGAGRDLGRQEVGEYLVPLLQDPELLRARVVATFEAVRNIPQVDGARVSAIGFCFGGQCALELARTGADLCSVVSFHGLLRTAIPARPGTIKAKVLSITGAKDPYVPAEDVVEFQREMVNADVDWQTTVYGTGLHAFAMPDVAAHNVEGAAYDPILEHLSWEQATAFLGATSRRVTDR